MRNPVHINGTAGRAGNAKLSRLAKAVCCRLVYGLLLSLCVMTSAYAADTDWPVHDGDKHGTRYSELGQINSSNVHRLKLAWSYRTGEMRRHSDIFSLSREQNIPLLVAGNLIICTPFDRIIALDPATGKERWFFDPSISLDMDAGDDSYACRGVAYWKDDKIGPDYALSRAGVVWHHRFTAVRNRCKDRTTVCRFRGQWRSIGLTRQA